MLFNSLQFLVFFPLVTALYFATPSRGRWLLLLAASCYFYMAFIPSYILILFVLIALDYAVGIGLEVVRVRPCASPSSSRASSRTSACSASSNTSTSSTTTWPDCGDAGRLVAGSLARHRPADRPLVPHVPVDGVHDRGLPGQPQGGAPPRDLRPVRDVLPAARRGADRAAPEPAPAVSPAPRLRLRRGSSTGFGRCCGASSRRSSSPTGSRSSSTPVYDDPANY